MTFITLNGPNNYTTVAYPYDDFGVSPFFLSRLTDNECPSSSGTRHLSRGRHQVFPKNVESCGVKTDRR